MEQSLIYPLTKNSKQELLEASLSPEEKELLQSAANLEGITITDFVIRSAEEKAHQIMEKYQIINLNLQDSQALAESLINPIPPNQRMLKLAQLYQQEMEQNET